MPSYVVQEGKNGWVTFSLNCVAFPPVCVGCERPADGHVPLRETSDHWLIAFVVAVLASEEPPTITLQIPLCYSCAPRFQRSGLMWGILVGLVLAGVAGAIVYWGMSSDVLETVASMVTAGLLGCLWGTKMGAQHLVQVKRYVPAKNSLMIRFGRREYTARFIAAVQARSDEENPFVTPPDSAAENAPASDNPFAF